MTLLKPLLIDLMNMNTKDGPRFYYSIGVTEINSYTL